MINHLPDYLVGTEVTAIVTSVSTSDKLMSINAQLNDKYEVYPSHIAKVFAYHIPTNTKHEKLMIWAKNERDEGWLPAECLTWLGKEKQLKKNIEVH